MTLAVSKPPAPRPPFKGATVTNVALELNQRGSNHSLACEFEGHRYHVWLNRKTFEPSDTILYKNAPSDLSSGEPGFFHTRRLSTEKSLGRWLVSTMLVQVKAQGLKHKAKQQAAAQAAAEKQARAERERLSRIQDAAEALYESLLAYVGRFTGEVPDLEPKARKLIRKIEGRRQRPRR